MKYSKNLEALELENLYNMRDLMPYTDPTGNIQLQFFGLMDHGLGSIASFRFSYDTIPLELESLLERQQYLYKKAALVVWSSKDWEFQFTF